MIRMILADRKRMLAQLLDLAIETSVFKAPLSMMSLWDEIQGDIYC